MGNDDIPEQPFVFSGEELDGVDGSDVDRVVRDLISRGGADATLGRFLRDKVSEYYAAVDPECCV